MDTGIYYLYEYNNNQKLRNTGFLKLSQQEHACFLQLNVRGLPVTQHDTAKLSAFYMENDSSNAAQVSDIICGNHTISEKLTIPQNHFPNQYDPDKIDGFFLTLPDGNILAATAPNIEFDTGKIIPVTEKKFPEASETADISKDNIQNTADIISQNSSVNLPQEEPEPDISATTLPEENKPEISQPFVRKIHRSELSCLPRRYWNLANNSFLLHGYYNYNHLLLVKGDGHYLLGVPGIYDPRESRAAELFGFTQFNDSYNQQLNLSETECNHFGHFGYWCRCLKL